MIGFMLAFASLLYSPAVKPEWPPLPDKPPAVEAITTPSKPDVDARPHFIVNDKTEVRLDGQVRKFEDVPATASVINLEVAPDKKTILKIYFESKMP
jgi:hypothetical protein